MCTPQSLFLQCRRRCHMDCSNGEPSPKRRRCEPLPIVVGSSNYSDCNANVAIYQPNVCLPGKQVFSSACKDVVNTIEAGLAQDEDNANETVCYGMLDSLPIASLRSSAGIIEISSLTPAYIDTTHTVRCTSNDDGLGKLDSTAAEALLKLDKEDNVHLQILVQTPLNVATKKTSKSTIAFAYAIIYGPRGLAADISDFLDQCKLCLEDPFACERNVPYVNPHSLESYLGENVMTFELRQPTNVQAELSITASLKVLETRLNLPEFTQPAAIRTMLSSHQKQGLSFMLQRELNQADTHVFEPKSLQDGSLMYINTLSKASQHVAPSTWNGGILADEMGVGKTLQIISLIAASNELQNHNGEGHDSHSGRPSLASRATLVVVPVNVLSVWEEQLRRHVHHGHLSWMRHHRRQKHLDSLDTACPHLVLTTYQTVQAEYKRREMLYSLLFSNHWRRVVLDEAHIVRNKTATSAAISAISATSRWAVTGTPIQNGLLDIVGLFRFLHFKPYDDAKAFDTDVLEAFRQNDLEEGTRRLKALCHPIMLRRTKDNINLPPRVDRVRTVEFSAEEKREYQRIESGAQSDPSMASNGATDTVPTRLSTIQLINRLRIFCNLGLATSGSSLEVSDPPPSATASPEVDSSTLMVASDVALGASVCTGCQLIIEADEAAVIYYSECNNVYCNDCAALSSSEANIQCSCSGISGCSLRAVPLALVQKASASQSGQAELCSDVRSSKVKAVAQEVLDALPEKSVVLSFWVASLVMTQRTLESMGVRCVRIDGSVEQAMREPIIEQFRTTDEINVLLTTISSGGVGLDLTAASRIHLLEPQWNPAVEDQALARVHRMGQVQPVVTMRYIMADSIEESVAKAKMNKQFLADILLKKKHEKMDVTTSLDSTEAEQDGGLSL